MKEQLRLKMRVIIRDVSPIVALQLQIVAEKFVHYPLQVVVGFDSEVIIVLVQMQYEKNFIRKASQNLVKSLFQSLSQVKIVFCIPGDI
jgi:hypothetical protein